MNWEKPLLIYRRLRIVRKYIDGTVDNYYAHYGYFSPKDYPFECERGRPIEIRLTHEDKEILVTLHEIERYSLKLRFETPPGTLGISSDELRIGIIDKTAIHYIGRRIFGVISNSNELDETFYFEENKLTSYKGRPNEHYEFIKGGKLKVTKLPGFTDGIPDDRGSVLDPILIPHYESFKQFRPDIAQSLDECLKELNITRVSKSL